MTCASSWNYIPEYLLFSFLYHIWNSY